MKGDPWAIGVRYSLFVEGVLPYGCAEVMLEDQLSDPKFIEELEQACRDYEMDVYGKTKVTEWKKRMVYCPFAFTGERYAPGGCEGAASFDDQRPALL